MDQSDHNTRLQGAPRELLGCVPEKPPSQGSSSPIVPANNMYQANWGTNRIPTPFLEQINEATFDTDTRDTFPETRQATDFLSLPVPLDPEGPTQGTRVPVDPPIDVNSLGNVNAQMWREQMSYSTDVNRANDLGNTRPELAPALGLPGHIPITNIGSLCSNENTGGLINVPNLMMAANPPNVWANPLSWQSNAIAAGCENNGSGATACNELNIKSSFLRIRGVRSPPQTYEGDVGRLCDRLIHEGADISTVMFLRYVIFAKEVTVDALLAPLQPSEVGHVCDGASRMWKMLLEMKEVTPGEKKFCCLLCPVGNRHQYKYSRDAIRHFNKDHFGFSYPCEYCNHQFFKDAERKIHAKKCDQRSQ